LPDDGSDEDMKRLSSASSVLPQSELRNDDVFGVGVRFVFARSGRIKRTTTTLYSLRLKSLVQLLAWIDIEPSLDANKRLIGVILMTSAETRTFAEV
jgi:hypothetical protein